MNEKLLKQLRELDFDKLADFIDTEVKDLYFNTVVNSCTPGFHHRILFNENAEFSVSGRVTTGSFFSGEAVGTMICLYKLYTVFDFDITEENIQLLTDDEAEKLYEKCALDILTTDEYFSDEYNIFDLCKKDFITVANCYKDIFQERYEQEMNDFIEDYWESYLNYKIYDDIVEIIKTELEAY